MSHNKYLSLPIKGMHCRSCELLIEEKLKDIPHIKDVEVSYQTGVATIYHDAISPDMGLITKALSEAGYAIGHADKLPFLSRDKKEYISLGVAFLFLMMAYLVLKGLGLTNINLNPDLSNPSFGLIILIGVVAGFSTCMALVGGLSLGLSTKFIENHPHATAAEKFRPHLFFVAGRILSYALLGGVLGLIGTVFQFSALANSILTILVGVVMLLMGLQLINVFPRLNKFKLSLPKSISRSLGINGKGQEYSHKHAIAMGALTFFLPCGFTQAMQLYAVSTGGFWSGALVMGLFAIGTAPGLLSIGGLTSLVRGNFKERFFKVAGLAVIFFALFNLNNGYTLASLSVGSFSGNTTTKTKVVKDPNVTMEDGVQVVRMVEGNSGYSPNKFSIKKGIPVKWIIDAQAPYSCASSIMIPQLNIKRTLKAGENIIEFTPEKAGKLPFSCSMGMYTGVFNVYEGDGPSATDLTASTPARSSGSCGASKPTANSGGSCGGGSASTASSGGSCGGSGGCGCGGGAKIQKDTVTTSATEAAGVQLIKTTYTQATDISPNDFTVKVNKPVRLEIYAKEDGAGCMSSIMIQKLYNTPELLEAGKTIVMEFTPTETGSYQITCGMGMNRGHIKVQ
jgi:sulfite exporter TauE/SafE/plastocyanin domain-containing protein/copper chaperone CopZ